MWRLNIRLHKVAPVDPALQKPIEIDAKMEKPEEVENVPMPGGIVVTKHQATLVEEAVRLVLLWWGGTTILVVLEGAGDGRLSSYRLAWALLELVFGLRTSPFLPSQALH